ncbi:MAG: hypothetical protein KIT14_13770 [bacterium]|nr:hypothetical protein [bacterium]
MPYFDALALGAIHESGHAVADIVLGVPLEFVCLDDDGTGLTRAWYEHRRREDDYLHAADDGARLTDEVAHFLRREVVRRLCGGVAEHVATKRRFRHYGDAGDDNDFLGALPAVRVLTGRPSNVAQIRQWQWATGRPQQLVLECFEWLEFERARRRGRTVLRRHWSAVERVAAALRRHRLLRGDTVRDLVNEAAKLRAPTAQPPSRHDARVTRARSNVVRRRPR